MYDSASELARELGVDRKTIYNYIRNGKIRTMKRKKRNYKISEREGNKIVRTQKIRREKTWTQQENNLLILDHASIKNVARLTNRTVNAVKVHKTILKKKGKIE